MLVLIMNDCIFILDIRISSKHYLCKLHVFTREKKLFYQLHFSLCGVNGKRLQMFPVEFSYVENIFFSMIVILMIRLLKTCLSKYFRI